MTAARPLLLAVALLAAADEAAVNPPEDAEIQASEEADYAAPAETPAQAVPALAPRPVRRSPGVMMGRLRAVTATQSGDIWLDCARRGTWRTPRCR